MDTEVMRNISWKTFPQQPLVSKGFSSLPLYLYSTYNCHSYLENKEKEISAVQQKANIRKKTELSLCLWKKQRAHMSFKLLQLN